MKIVAMKKYKTPEYPTKNDFNEKEMPEIKTNKKWNESIIKSSLTVAMAALLLNGCSYGGNVTSGEVAAPYILTEEEALRIIYEEASAVGINLKPNHYTIDKFKLITDESALKKIYSNVSLENKWVKESIELAKETEISFTIDAYDEEKKIGIEYISQDDEELGFVGQYNLQELANYTLEKKEPDKYIKIIQAEGFNGSKENATEELRKELQEFFEWCLSVNLLTY